MISVKNSTWIMTLACCGQILSHKLRASYPILGKDWTGHQGISPFSCSLSAWNNSRRLLGGPAVALADESVWATAGDGTHTRSWGDALVSRGTLDRSWMPLGKNDQVVKLTAPMAGGGWVVGVSEGAGQEESRYRRIFVHSGTSQVQKRRLWQCLHSLLQV